MRFRVFLYYSLRARLLKAPNLEINWINKIRRKLQKEVTGKILHYDWFREKKFRDKRLMYVIDYRQRKILLVDFVKKKEQQKAIDFVLENKEKILNCLRDLD